MNKKPEEDNTIKCKNKLGLCQRILNVSETEYIDYCRCKTIKNKRFSNGIKIDFKKQCKVNDMCRNRELRKIEKEEAETTQIYFEALSGIHSRDREIRKDYEWRVWRCLVIISAVVWGIYLGVYFS